MTLKQTLFVEAYLSNGGNATDAARKAGYKGDDDAMRARGAETVANRNVRAAIDARMEEVAAKRGILSAEDVLDLISQHASGSMDDFTTAAGRGVRLDLAKAKKAGKFHLVKEFKKTDKGTEIKLYDAQAAAALLGKHHGIFTDTLVIQDAAMEMANGIADDALNILREYITDDNDYANAVDAFQSRLSARFGRSGAGPREKPGGGAAIPDAALVA
jgi:phage terminase small subunit